MARQKKRSAARATVNQLLKEGWRALARQQPRRAEQYFRRALKLHPGNAEAWHGLGVALHQQGKKGDAYQALHTSLQLDPSVPEAWHALAQVADALGYTIEALESAREAARLAREQHRPEEMVEGLEITARALEQALHRLAEEMGVSLKEEGWQEKVKACVRAYQAGLEAMSAGEYEKAAERFQECVELAPKSARAWGNLGLAQLLLKRFDEAEASLRRALSIRPDYEPARYNLNMLVEARKRPDMDLTALLHRYTDLKHNAPSRKDIR